MATFNMHDAKSQLSDLVARAESGEEVLIARRNRPAVKLVSLETAERRAEGAADLVVEDPPHDDPFEHAPDDHISKEDIAAYYRKYPSEWREMRAMVGFAEDARAQYDVAGLREALEAGREFTILRDGKAVAKVAPAGAEKTSRRPGGLKGAFTLPESFFDPLPDDEIAAWEGKYSSDPTT